MILAGDIGATKTLLGIFHQAPGRPEPLAVHSFVTLDYPDLTAIISAFSAAADVKGADVETACFGVAGPVLGTTAQLTNVPWRIEVRRVAEAFAIPKVRLLNDLQAMAYAVPVLGDAELHVLQEGEARQNGSIGIIAAGTGLGAALLHAVDGRFVPSPTESGHADWAARTERDITVLRALVQRFGRAEVEQVVSGFGMVNLHRVTHTGRCPAVESLDGPTAATAICAAALAHSCPGCVEALSIFIDAYGAEAGNLALRTLATGGVFIAGGIARGILPALTDGRFMDAFRDKAPFRELLAEIPVKVVLNPAAGLLGAAIHAAAS